MFSGFRSFFHMGRNIKPHTKQNSNNNYFTNNKKQSGINIHFLFSNQIKATNPKVTVRFNNITKGLYWSTGKKIDPQATPKVTWAKAIKSWISESLFFSLNVILVFVSYLLYFPLSIGIDPEFLAVPPISQEGFIKLTKKSLISILGVWIVIVSSGLLYLFNPFSTKKAEAAWFDEAWAYREEIPVTSTNGSTLAYNYLTTPFDTQTLITNNKLQSSCQDIRVTDSAGNVLKRRVGRSTACNSTTTTLDFLVPSFPDGKSTYYVYYGNPNAASDDNGSNFTQSAGGTYSVGVFGTEALSPGPTLYWKFDDAVDPTAKDSSTNNNPGTFNKIAKDVATSAQAGGSQSSISWSHTVAAGLNLILVVETSILEDVAVSNIKYNNVALTKIRNDSVGANKARTEIWYLVNPSTGSNTVAVTLASTLSASHGITAGAISFSGVDQTNPIDANTGNTDAVGSSSISDSITTVANNAWIVDVHASGSTDPTAPIPTSPQTQDWAFASSTGSTDPGAGGSDRGPITPPASTAMAWTLGASRKWAHSVASLKPSQTASWQTEDMCVEGKCLRFDGSTGYVRKTYSTDTELNPGTASFTLSVWAKHASAISGTDTIISRADALNGVGYKLYMPSNGTICFGIDDTAGSFPADSACSTATFNDSKWHIIEATKNGTTNIKIYVDGVLLATTTVTATSSISGSSPTFAVGLDSDITSNPWDGFIDEVKFYNYLRSASQILTDYNSRNNSKGASERVGREPNNNRMAFNDNLVGYWKEDETSSGATATDSSGNGTSLTDTATVTRAAGKYSYGSTFNGTTQYQYAADNNTLSLTGSVTVSAWINPSTVAAGAYDIAGKWDGNTSYLLQQNASDIRFYVGSASNYEATTSLSLTTSTWYHVLASYNATTGKVQIYVNGLLKTSSTTGTIPTSIADGTDRFQIGADSSSGTATNFYNGSLDEIRVYSKALSSAEALALANFAPGPVGYWKLDENTGTTANDASSNANTGVITVGTGGWIPGKFGTGYNFDKANTKIDAGSYTNLDNLKGGGGLSAEAWIYPKSTGEGGANGGVIIGKATGPTNTVANGWFFFVTTSNALEFTSDGSTTDLLRLTSSTLTLNTWSHVAVTWDGSTTATNCKIYINGVEAAYSTTTNGNGLTSDATPTLIIGNDSTQADTFDGYIDEAKVYNYPRSPGQEIEDMNGGHPAPGSPIGSPVAYWKMDEGYGTTANDSAALNGAGENLTLSTASWTNSGKFGKAWDGNGVKYLSVSDPANGSLDFAAADDFSISLWFKSDSASNPGATEFLLNKVTASAGYAIYANTDGTICFGIDDDSTWTPDDSACNTKDIYDATWHHIVATKTGTTRIDLYVDGYLAGSDTSIAATGTLANSATFYLGDKDGTDNGDEFTGDLDEVKIFRSAMTADQVKVEYNRGSAQTLGALSDNSTYQLQAANQEYCVPGDSSTCTAPVGRWEFEEGTGTTANDITGNASTGTLTNMGPNATSGWNPAGKHGGGMQFDSTNDYIAMGSDLSALKITGSLTISAWAKVNSFSTTNNIFSKFTGTASTSSYLLTFNTSSQLRVKLSDGATIPVYDSTGTFSTGTWYHVAAVYTAGSSVKLYINGVLDINSTSSIPASLANSTTIVDIGAQNVGASGFFNGTLDDVRIYNYARSPEQIRWDMNQGKPVLWYKMDECQGTTLNDSSGNSYTGTLAISTGGTQTTTIG